MPTELVIADGDFLGAALVCLIAGLLAFASPCVLPILPGFLGYVAGRPDPEGRRPGGW